MCQFCSLGPGSGLEKLRIRKKRSGSGRIHNTDFFHNVQLGCPYRIFHILLYVNRICPRLNRKAFEEPVVPLEADSHNPELTGDASVNADIEEAIVLESSKCGQVPLREKCGECTNCQNPHPNRNVTFELSLHYCQVFRS
jgi:hypothetical protein